MNYGYADIIKENGYFIDNLQEEDEYERFPLQMYKFVASCHSKIHHFHNQTIVEVGSGRGK
jgi:type III secretion system FlhB-like substrate exporter